jgi:hypothetical protein
MQTDRHAYGGGTGKEDDRQRPCRFSIHAGKQSPDEQLTKLHVQQAYPTEFRETV